jgi:sortase A
MSSVTTSRQVFRASSAPRLSLLCWSRFFFLAGIVALGYVAATLIDEKLYQARATAEFAEALSAPKPTLPGDVAPSSPAPAVAGSRTPLGRIEISSLGVAAMILEGTDDKTLRRAVGHIPGTALPGQPGNVGLAGHRDTFFRALRNIHKDDEITLQTLNGLYRYSVDLTQVVDPGQTEVLNRSDDSILTLVTCYPFYFVGSAPQRFIVRAHRIL